jgi:hypothetical protein
MQAESAFLADARRVMESLDRTRRSAEAERQPFLLWGLSLVLALALVGYPIAATVADLLGVDNAVANFPYRGLTVAVALGVAILSISKGHYKLPLLVMLFMTAYLLRLVVDNGEPAFVNAQRDTIFYIGSVLIPALAMGAAHFYYDERDASFQLMAIGSVACVLILASLILTGEVSLGTILNQRSSLETLNAITIAYTGVLTAAGAYSARAYIPKQMRLFVVWPVIALGGLTFLLGGSRGPLVGVALFFGLQALIRGRGALAAAIFLVCLTSIGAVMFADIALFQRFSNISNDPGVIERLIVQRMSLEQGLAHPFLGSAYVELTSLAYPHNLLIESLMALGIPGAFLMLVLQCLLFRDILTMMRVGHILAPMIATTALVNSWISASIFGSREFFISIIICGLIAGQIRIANQFNRRRDASGRHSRVAPGRSSPPPFGLR